MVNDPYNAAQHGQMPLGKILRLDVNSNPAPQPWGHYAIPDDNPFVGTSDAMPEIYALGFRNPWRCSVDPVTNLTICTDFGKVLCHSTCEIVLCDSTVHE